MILLSIFCDSLPGIQYYVTILLGQSVAISVGKIYASFWLLGLCESILFKNEYRLLILEGFVCSQDFLTVSCLSVLGLGT